ncbi:MAG: hypothetical protein M3256_09215 [Actinomycetota bacterium]|nr:hypothetical protein [Actinomycetota bacterium]
MPDPATSRHHRHLLHRPRLAHRCGQHRGHHRVAGLVAGDAGLLILGDDPGPATAGALHPLDRLVEMVTGNHCGVVAHRQ